MQFADCRVTVRTVRDASRSPHLQLPETSDVESRGLSAQDEGLFSPCVSCLPFPERRAPLLSLRLHTKTQEPGNCVTVSTETAPSRGYLLGVVRVRTALCGKWLTFQGETQRFDGFLVVFVCDEMDGGERGT